MLNENAKKWVAALRSEQYKQAKLALEKPNGNCCLGVACREAIKDGLSMTVIPTGPINFCVTFGGKTTELPESVRKHFVLKSSHGHYGTDGKQSLMADNDVFNKTFAEIADIIESEPEGLFE